MYSHHSERPARCFVADDVKQSEYHRRRFREVASAHKGTQAYGLEPVSPQASYTSKISAVVMGWQLAFCHGLLACYGENESE